MANESDHFGVLGDFEEIYNEIYVKEGLFQAKKWYWKQVIFSIPQFIKNKIYWGVTMFKNYMKIAFRMLLKHKGFSFINIVGLATGLAIGMLMILYVINELSYDKHIKNSCNKYSALTTLSMEGKEFTIGQTAAPAVEDMKAEFPEIKSTTRMYYDGGLFKYKDKAFKEDKLFYAEANVFDFFSIDLLVGNPVLALEAPNSIVLTEESALKYFGDEDPIGKVLQVGDTKEFTVTGICRRNPTTTHFQFDFLASFITVLNDPEHAPFINGWMGFNYRSYIELYKAEDYQPLMDKLPDLVERKAGDIARMFGASIELSFEPITDVYLYSVGEAESVALRGNVTNIILFSIIGGFIILIACINFMNLSTARSINRLKEIGMRKVLGAGRKKIIAQFLGESVFFSFIGFLLALILFYLLVPFFSVFVSKQLEVFMLLSPFGIGGMIILFLIVSLLSGSYPALYISRNQPVNALLGKSGKTGGSKIFRNVLVNFQFAISIVLISVTVVIYNQLEFLKNKDLGYDLEQVLVLKVSGNAARSSHDVIKTKIQQVPGVLNVAGSSLVPGRGSNTTAYKFGEVELGENSVISSMDVDHDYMSTMEMKLVKGRFFSDEFGSDNNSVIINRTLANLIGWEDPIGRTVEQMELEDQKPVYRPYTIIGVMDDYHFASLHMQIKPHILFSTGKVRYLSMKISSDKTEEVIASVKSIWEEVDPNRPMDYFFLDESFYSQYQAEQRFGEIFIYFTILAIIISCLGLFGLTSFAAEQRQKEVGIRKTLGAGIGTIVYLLAKDFLRWVILANVIAIPIAYYAISKWLESFAYKIEIGIAPFLISGILALLIALITVSFQTTKAAIVNPVDSIKYE